jgi:hypothetical protein
MINDLETGTVSIAPRTQALVIRGWLYLFATTLLSLLFLFNGLTKKDAFDLSIGAIILLGGLCYSANTLTTRITIARETFRYSRLLLLKTEFRLSDVEAVIVYRIPDFGLLPITKLPKLTKPIYAIVPVIRKCRTTRIDGSLFSQVQLQTLDKFFAEKIERPASYEDALRRIAQLAVNFSMRPKGLN